MKLRRTSRNTSATSGNSESGQSLVLFAGALLFFLGLVAMSVDVGRFVWARTQMQAAVDAAALGAAQSMPHIHEAEEQARFYWEDNSTFIRNADPSSDIQISYPPGNKRVRVSAEAEIPTWFARLFGVDQWEVSASGDAESQVLDIAVVLDISGSMCFDSYIRTENTNNVYLMSPGRTSPSGYSFPRLTQAIASGGNNEIYIYLNDIGIFTSESSSRNRTNFGSGWNTSTPYWQRDPDGNGGVRPGMIMIDNELFQITGVRESQGRLTVRRAQRNEFTGTNTAKAYHAAGSEVWALRHGYAHGTTDGNDYCDAVSYYHATSSQNGPHQPFDSAISNAQYFVTLFDDDYDKIGVATYSTDARVVSSLTANFSSLQASMNGILFPAGGTNIADGIARGRQLLDGAGKRANAVRVLVLLTDGVPTHYCSNGYSGSCNSQSSSTPTTCPYPNTTAVRHAMDQAEAAAESDILIFTIGLGGGVLPCILEEIADIGEGSYVAAPTVADLEDAFREIAEQTHIALVN